MSRSDKSWPAAAKIALWPSGLWPWGGPGSGGAAVGDNINRGGVPLLLVYCSSLLLRRRSHDEREAPATNSLSPAIAVNAEWVPERFNLISPNLSLTRKLAMRNRLAQTQ